MTQETGNITSPVHDVVARRGLAALRAVPAEQADLLQVAVPGGLLLLQHVQRQNLALVHQVRTQTQAAIIIISLTSFNS